MNAFHTASIVIPTLNRHSILRETIKSLLDCDPIGSLLEIIVVDQSDEDNKDQSSQDAIFNHPLVKYYCVSFRGTTKARNFGTNAALGDIIIFVDDDVVVTNNFIQAHLSKYIINEITGVAGSVLHEGEQQISKNQLSVKQLKDLNLGRHTRFDLAFEYAPLWARGCNMSFRREWIVKLNGFDENFFGIALGEEPEFCHRMMAAGGKIIYAPDTVLLHVAYTIGGSRNESREKQRFMDTVENGVYYWNAVEPIFHKRWSGYFSLFKNMFGGLSRLISLRTPIKLVWIILAYFRGIKRFHKRHSTPPEILFTQP